MGAPSFQVPAILTPGERVLNVCTQAKCDYCGRYGALGSCEGCGAPNRPTRGRIDVTTMSDKKPVFLDAE
jgi:hypothetical protein